MALQSLVLASFLLLASAEVAFVQPNLQSTRPLRGVRQLASAQEGEYSSFSAKEEAPETSSSWSSLLVGAALGLIVSLSGSMTASAFYVPERGDDPSGLNGRQYPTSGKGQGQLQPGNPPAFEGVPDECTIRSKLYNPSQDANLTSLARRQLEFKSKDTKLGWFPTYKGYEDSMNKCLQKVQTNIVDRVYNAQLKKTDWPTYGIPTTAKDQDKKTGELYGAKFGINRVGFGKPNIGKQTVSGSGRAVFGGGGKYRKMYGDGKTYADPLTPGYGVENPALRGWAEGKGYAMMDEKGNWIPNSTDDFYHPFGKSKVLLNMPFYKSKTVGNTEVASTLGKNQVVDRPLAK